MSWSKCIIGFIIMLVSCYCYYLFAAQDIWHIHPFYHSPRVNGSGSDVTLVVHLSKDRIHRLLDLCNKWEGAISASYLILNAEDELQIHETILGSKCIQEHVGLHIVKLKQNIQISQDMQVSYPFNVMRNVALDNAPSTFVFLLDIDFHVIPCNHSLLSKIATREATKRTQSFWVAPAFETISDTLPLPTSKDDILQMISKRLVCPFYGHYCVNCHLPTNYKLWENARKSYPVPYLEGYEPYVIANKSQLPRYDERFNGRGWDKMSFFYELHAMNMTAVVVPELFIIHQGRPNQPSNYTPEYMANFHRNKAHWENFKSDMYAKYME